MKYQKNKIFIPLVVSVLLVMTIVVVISTRPPSSISSPLTLEQQVRSLVHPAITKYHVQLLNGSPLREEVDAGRTITLIIVNQQFTLDLEPNDLLDPAYAATLSEEARDIGTYQGVVVGELDSSVALSLRPNVVKGFIRVGMERWFIEPLTNFGDPATVGAPVNTHIIYLAADVDMSSVNLTDDVNTPMNV